MDEEKLYGRVGIAENTTVEYYLITNKIGGEYCDLMSYGVKLVKTARFLGGGKTVEAKQINNIFYNIDDAERFLSILKRGTVTPTTLSDVVEDYITDLTA